jgi:4-amino-4-deoxychorismate mutase
LADVQTSLDGAHLGRLRARVDRLDEDLVRLLARRFSLCCEIGAEKRRSGLRVTQPERAAEVHAHCARLAEQYGVSPQFVREVYQQIMAEACRLEEHCADFASQPDAVVGSDCAMPERQ